MMNVRLFKPCVGEEELNSIREVFDISWLGLGGKVNELEDEWGKFIGSRFCVATNSATAALHLALAVKRFPPGKKVLVPSLTFASTACAILYNQLVPVFVDCDEDTLGICVEDLQRKYDSDCVAVMVVHFGGHPCNMDAITDFANEKGIHVVEDCAHTQGSRWNGRALGTWGDIGCFSFEEKKGMTTGDGGMLCTDHGEFVEAFKAMRWVGIDKDTWKRKDSYTADDHDSRHWYYEIEHLGYKYNMNNLAAAIGLAQLRKLAQFNASKRHAIRRYLDGIKPDTDAIRPLLPYDLNDNASYWLFGVRVDDRDSVVTFLKSRGIATGVHYTPLHHHPLFSQFHADVPVTEQVYKRILTLPLFPDISDDEIDYVVAALHEFACSNSPSP